MEHTKEPWEIFSFGKDELGSEYLTIRGNFRENETGKWFHSVVHMNIHKHTQVEDLANARRIVDCVNACADVPRDYLDDLKPGDMMKALEWLYGIRKPIEPER